MNHGAIALLTSLLAGYFINCKADPEDQNNALLVVKHLVADQHTLAVLATSRPLHEIDLAPILNTARKASSNPMLLPTALADLMVTAEAAGTTKIDDTLSQLERGNRALLHSASKLSTTVDQVEHTAQTLNDVRNALGRSERRLRSLALLLATCMAEIGMLSIIAPPHPQWDTAAAERILQGHNANLRSDVDHLLLQVQNNNARAQTQQQVVCTDWSPNTRIPSFLTGPISGVQLHEHKRGHLRPPHRCSRHERRCGDESIGSPDNSLFAGHLSCCESECL